MPGNGRHYGPSVDHRKLTPREKEVVELLKTRRTNKEIAIRLHISVATVKNHLHSVYRKLGVGGRYEAADVAIQRDEK